MVCSHPNAQNEIFCSLCGLRLQDKTVGVKDFTASERYKEGLIYLANDLYEEALIKFKSSVLSPSLKIKSLQMVIYTLFCKGLDGTLKPQFLYQCEKLKEAYLENGKEEKEIKKIIASIYSSTQLEKVLKGEISFSSFFERCRQEIEGIPKRGKRFFSVIIAVGKMSLTIISVLIVEGI